LAGGDFFAVPEECGGPELRVHPAWIVTAESLQVLRLWDFWQGRPQMGAVMGMNGAASFEAGRSQPLLPFQGAIADQPAALIDAFQACDQAWAAYEKPA